MYQFKDNISYFIKLQQQKYIIMFVFISAEIASPPTIHYITYAIRTFILLFIL